MKTKYMVYFLALILCTLLVSDSFGQVRSYRVSKDNSMIPNEKSTVVYQPSVYIPMKLLPAVNVGDAIIGPEQLTTITGWYDYATNGDCRHFILMDPSDPNKLHAHFMESDSLEPGGSTSRRTMYAYSTDGGTTWTYGCEVPAAFRSGFSYMCLSNTGSAVISNHNTRQSTLNTHLYVDLFPQLASFSEYLTPSTNGFAAWGQCNLLSNNNVLLVGEQYASGNGTDTLMYTVFNGTSTNPWTSIPAVTGISQTNIRWANATTINGNAVIIADPISDVNGGLGASKIYAIKSTDNGTTWGAPEVAFSPFVNGTDTIAPYLSIDVMYKPNTTDYYLAFNTLGNSMYKKCQLWVTKNGGTPHIVADSNTVPNTSTMQSMAGIVGIDHPSLGFSADGQVLYCAFSVVTADTGLRGWNTRDMFYSYSTDEGVTWAPAIRITNTPLIDEGYCSVSRINPGNSPSSYVLHLVYMKDPGDGPSSFNGTSSTAPATRNWLVYRKIEMPTVGIRQNSTVVKGYSLSQNYPNPFNPTTSIKFSIEKSSFVSLKVYDITGKEVASLVNEKLSTGSYDYSFTAKNLSSGLYFYTLKAGDFKETKKMMLIK